MGSGGSKISTEELARAEMHNVWNLQVNVADYTSGQCIFSPTFTDKISTGPSWRIMLYPSGYAEELKDYVSVFVQCLSDDWNKLGIDFTVALSSADRELGIRERRVMLKYSRTIGWPTFVAKSHIGEHLLVKCELKGHCYTKKPDEEDSQPDDGRLSDDMTSLYEGERFSDVTLQMDGHGIRAHRLILAARSSVFSHIFTQQQGDAKCLKLDCASKGTSDAFVRFLYSGKTADFTAQSAMDMYTVARRYAVFALVDRCMEFLASHYDEDNAVGMLTFANKFQEDRLKEKVVDFLASHFKSVGVREDWQECLKVHPALGSEVLCRVATNYQDGTK